MSSTEPTRTISIVVPVYNPQERIFRRVLDAIQQLEIPPGHAVDCVIVDNRSMPPLVGSPAVQRFLAGCPHARLVREDVPGLTSARLAGFRATRGDLVVVFDDDNVPARDYLHVAARCAAEYPFVGVWGPGTVEVELLDHVPAWLQQRVKGQHGHKHHRSVEYGCARARWCDFYPAGMGQVIRRDVAEQYRLAVETGVLSATDRKGSSLASAGDNQIVWQAVNMGAAAGVHPDLTLHHLIPGRRTTVQYLRRLNFGCAVSHLQALAQSFPEETAAWQGYAPSTLRLAMQASRVVVHSAVRDRWRFLTLDLAELLGEWCGYLTVAGRHRHWTFELAKRLRLT
jgi:hypothetical protein